HIASCIRSFTKRRSSNLQPDERRRAGSRRRVPAAQAARGAERSRRMRVLSLTHGPLVRAELFGDVIRAEGHELVEWEIVTQGRRSEEHTSELKSRGHLYC